jgi:hypothetical protein
MATHVHLTSVLQAQTNVNIRHKKWQKFASNQCNSEASDILYSNSEQAFYDVLPNEWNSHCLFVCFVEILHERNQTDLPDSVQTIRTILADYFDQIGGFVAVEGVNLPCHQSIRTDGAGSVAEVFAFASLYKVSIEVCTLETNEVQVFYRSSPEVVPELLLHTRRRQDAATSADGDRWQRLKKKNIFLDASSQFSKMTKAPSDFLLSKGSWRRCASDDSAAGRHGVDAEALFPNLEHDLYEVVPITRDSDSLYNCLLCILWEHAPESQLADVKSLRSVISHYLEHNDRELSDECGLSLQFGSTGTTLSGADSARYHTRYGRFAEILAFSKCFSIPISVHCPEAAPGATTFGMHFNGTPLSLLLTLGWDQQERDQTQDHWQVLRPRQQHPNGGSISSLGLNSCSTPSSRTFLQDPNAAKANHPKVATHPKVDNPRKFPLPLSDTLILQENVFLQVSTSANLAISHLTLCGSGKQQGNHAVCGTAVDIDQQCR